MKPAVLPEGGAVRARAACFRPVRRLCKSWLPGQLPTALSHANWQSTIWDEAA